MRYLVVSSFPPTHCGIAAYAEQTVNQLRSQGHVVDVLAPDGQGNADYLWDLRGGSNILRLRELLPYYDKIVIQFVWSFYYRDPFNPRFRADTLKTTISFIRLFLSSPKIEVVAHEIPYLSGRARRLHGLMWRFVPRLVLHTDKERSRFEEHYGVRLLGSRIELRDHHQVFQKFSSHTRESARATLRIPAGALIFLCIGFIQRHKGFDRAIRSFLNLNMRGAALYVVGSLRIADDENRRYLAELYSLAKGHDDIHIVESFVSNEEFDTWITAADCIVFPYAEIWSSGVLARTRLLGRRAIVAAVGGLTEQAASEDLVFRTDEQLTDCMKAVADAVPTPL